MSKNCLTPFLPFHTGPPAPGMGATWGHRSMRITRAHQQGIIRAAASELEAAISSEGNHASEGRHQRGAIRVRGRRQGGPIRALRQCRMPHGAASSARFPTESTTNQPSKCQLSEISNQSSHQPTKQPNNSRSWHSQKACPPICMRYVVRAHTKVST